MPASAAGRFQTRESCYALSFLTPRGYPTPIPHIFQACAQILMVGMLVSCSSNTEPDIEDNCRSVCAQRSCGIDPACQVDCGECPIGTCSDAGECVNVEPGCGNSILEPGELCDGSATGNATCQSQGFSGGSLGCTSTCDGFDTSACLSDNCTPDCSTQECGPDPICNESCGTCAPGTCQEGRCVEASVDAPTIVQFSSNRTTLTEDGTLVLSAIVTDPQGSMTLSAARLRAQLVRSMRALRPLRVRVRMVPRSTGIRFIRSTALTFKSRKKLFWSRSSLTKPRMQPVKRSPSDSNAAIRLCPPAMQAASISKATSSIAASVNERAARMVAVLTENAGVQPTTNASLEPSAVTTSVFPVAAMTRNAKRMHSATTEPVSPAAATIRPALPMSSVTLSRATVAVGAT